MEDTKIIKVTVDEGDGIIKITNPEKIGGPGSLEEEEEIISINTFRNIGTEGGRAGAIPGKGDKFMTLELFKKQQRYLNWLDSWKDLKSGGGIDENYQQFINGLGIWSGDDGDEPFMSYKELHEAEGIMINSVIDTLTNRSWTKLKRGSELDIKLEKDRVQHDCGLSYNSFITKKDRGERGRDSDILYKTLGTFLDPAVDIQGGVNYPPPGVTISFEQSFMNAMGFPGKTSVMGAATNVSDNRWTYTITYGSGCDSDADCIIERGEGKALTMDDKSFNKQNDHNRKFFGGNNKKGSVLNNPNASSNDKRKLIVSKELGDRMQIFCHMVMVKLANPQEEIVLITCDMVVFITCIAIRLPVIYTGTSLAKNPKYCQSLGIDQDIIQGKFYSVTEYTPYKDGMLDQVAKKYNDLRENIIEENNKLIDLVIRFINFGEFSTIGLTNGKCEIIERKIQKEFFERSLAVLLVIQARFFVRKEEEIKKICLNDASFRPPATEAETLFRKAVEAGIGRENYKKALKILFDVKKKGMPIGNNIYGKLNDESLREFLEIGLHGHAERAIGDINNKIRTMKRDCVLLHFIYIKKGTTKLAIHPSMKSFTACKPAQNNKGFYGLGKDFFSITIHDCAWEFLYSASASASAFPVAPPPTPAVRASGGGRNKLLIQTGGFNQDSSDVSGAGDEIYLNNMNYDMGEGRIMDGVEKEFFHIHSETPIFDRDVLQKDNPYDNSIDMPEINDTNVVNVLEEDKVEQFKQDSLELVKKLDESINEGGISKDEEEDIFARAGVDIEYIRLYLNCIYEGGFDDMESLISIANQDSWFKGELEGIISYVCRIKGVEAVDEGKINSFYEKLKRAAAPAAAAAAFGAAAPAAAAPSLFGAAPAPVPAKLNINTVEMGDAEVGKVDDGAGVRDGAGEEAMVVAQSDSADEGAEVKEERSLTPPPGSGSPIRAVRKRKIDPGMHTREEEEKRAKPTFPPTRAPGARGGKRRKRRTKKHAKKRTRNGKRRYTRNKKRPHNKKKRRANKKAKTHRKKPIKSKKGRKTTRKHLRRRSR